MPELLTLRMYQILSMCGYGKIYYSPSHIFKSLVVHGFEVQD